MKKLFIVCACMLIVSIPLHAQTTAKTNTTYTVITREEATSQIVTAKQVKSLTFQQIADAVGKDEVWVASALLGQNTMSADEAAKACALLGLGKDVEMALQIYAVRGQNPMPPSDPLEYRFYEIVMIYGPTLKAVIQEEFGEGIMSAINFSMHVDRVPDPAGDRVKVTMEGKFLDYKKW